MNTCPSFTFHHRLPQTHVLGRGMFYSIKNKRSFKIILHSIFTSVLKVGNHEALWSDL